MTWGEGGFSGPPKKGDVIYERPLTHHTVLRIEIYETKVDFVAGDLPSVVETQNEVMSEKSGVNASHAFFQRFV